MPDEVIRSTLFAAVHESAVGRFCCKSPKIPGDDFFERKEAKLSSPINMAPRPLRKSPVRLSPKDEVAHVFIRESHQRPRKILMSGGKRLLQQNRHNPDPIARAEQVRSAQVDQTSTCSAIERASSTSMPRYLTVLSILVWPSKSCTARRFPVRR